MTIPTTCTIGPSAVTGERCGKPAVISFTGRNGEVYAECAEHYIPTVGFPYLVGCRVRVFHAGAEKIGTVTKVTGTRVHVEVPVKPHGKPATTRVVTFAKNAVVLV